MVHLPLNFRFYGVIFYRLYFNEYIFSLSRDYKSNILSCTYIYTFAYSFPSKGIDKSYTWLKITKFIAIALTARINKRIKKNKKNLEQPLFLEDRLSVFSGPRRSYPSEKTRYHFPSSRRIQRQVVFRKQWNAASVRTPSRAEHREKLHGRL